MKNTIELLSPGGSFDAVRGAVACGCGAVYLGGKNFSARGAAENFDEEDLKRAVDFCHLRGVKVFLTINTLYKDRELSALFDFAGAAYSMGVDAFILQDIGCFDFLKRNFPAIAYHASTQLTAHSESDAAFLREAGFDRIVLSRELSLEEIKHICESVDAEFEVFAGGALCYSYSGACLMSAFRGGRSGNRGRCAQPCRLKYRLFRGDSPASEEKYLLSPKDIMTLDNIAGIAASGVKSLKIEGRLKSPEYVAVVTQAYRAALDGETDLEAHKNRVAAIFNRGGFSGGYFSQYSGGGMMADLSPKSVGAALAHVAKYDKAAGIMTFTTSESLSAGDGLEVHTRAEPHAGAYFTRKAQAGETVTVKIAGNIARGDAVYRSYDKRLNDEAKRLYEADTRKLRVRGEFYCRAGEPLRLALSLGAVSAAVTGETASEARNQPMTAEGLVSRLGKTGAYPLEIDFVRADVGENVFANVSALNDLKRRACQEFTDKYAKSFERELPPVRRGNRPRVPPDGREGAASLRVLVSTEAQLDAAIEAGVDRIYAEKFAGREELCRQSGTELFAVLSPISRNGIPEDMLNADVSGFLARTWGQLRELNDLGKTAAADFTLNTFNALSNEFMSRFAETVAPSVELEIPELRFCRGFNELVIYGRLPLMTTALCPVGIYAAEKDEGRFCRLKGRAGGFALKDRMGALLPVVTDCAECHARILSDRPLYMLDKPDRLRELLCAGAFRLDFTVEPPETVSEIIARAKSVLAGNPPGKTPENIFYGHYFKGSL